MFCRSEGKMVTGSSLLVRIAFFLHVLSWFSAASSQNKGLHYGKMKNVVTDGIATVSSTTTRSAVSCAVECSTESKEGRCTIATYNKTSRTCTFTTSSASSLIYYDANDTITLFPQSDCDSNELPVVADGVYKENPSLPGIFYIECGSGYELSLTNDINAFACDVDSRWLSSNVTCLPKAYTRNVEGREFLAAFMANYEFPNVTLRFYVIASEPREATFQYSTLTVEAPQLSYKKTYTLSQYLEIEIPSEIGTNGDAIFLNSDRPVTVFAMNINQYSTGGTLVLPKQSLGNTYLVAATPYDDFLSGLMIIANQNQTEVTLNFPDKTSQSVDLDYGNTYEVVRSGLSGTYIEADKEIVVFAGEKCANLPDPGNYSCDHIVEQMPPVEALDTTYIVARAKPRPYFGVLIAALNDSTSVSINDEFSMTLHSAYMNRHDTVFRTFTDNNTYLSVTADKPVLVTQYGVSTTVDNQGQGDPSMLVVPGVNHFLSKYRFAVPDGYDTNKVIIVYNITDGYDPRQGLKHNEVIEFIPEMTSVFLWNDIFGVCYLELEAGVHNLENSVPFGAILYGQGIYKEYSWNLGLYM